MRVIAHRTLREYWERHPDSQAALAAWHEDAKRADWKSPAQIKSAYGSSSIIGNSRAVFNIKGNDYRLVVKVAYQYGVVYIRFIGTHREYDSINAETV